MLFVNIPALSTAIYRKRAKKIQASCHIWRMMQRNQSHFYFWSNFLNIPFKERFRFMWDPLFYYYHRDLHLSLPSYFFPFFLFCCSKLDTVWKFSNVWWSVMRSSTCIKIIFSLGTFVISLLLFLYFWNIFTKFALRAFLLSKEVKVTAVFLILFSAVTWLNIGVREVFGKW